MRDWEILRARYERDDPTIQLGGLASNLSRIEWFGHRAASRREVASLFRESKYFTEWAACRCSLEQQGLLAELQVQLAIWERGWDTQLSPLHIAAEVQQWPGKLLEASGLLSG